ncbi:phosphate ABC transporter substrate-binding protein PstS [Nocardioides mangrovicus]|uniref:Phosphate ABC transporter substrate-binding protein PstS n=2 Tax=Nocardioides mangrovicus TaxID=2478913 RepID=A0A3L8NZU8_9ACTN|nr:phosphate ABC transporter substrate-binding protein PstS [Nocardioides mangrovicus]
MRDTSYAEIEGSGSTWSQVILQQWISDVNSLGMQVTYNGNGSSQGRKDFANNVTDFGISEIPFQGTDPVTHQADTSNGRQYAYLPIVAGGTAFTYQLKVGGQQVKNLRLSGETIAKIFTNQITNWNDPAITKDNNGRAFPALPITPVVRSDGSGTTAQFTRYLDTMFPAIWRPYNGQSGLTSQFPRKGRQIAASGSDQVMNTIDGAAGNGTIGYVEYSYPLNAHYPVVKVLNNGGYYVEPTQYNVAVALTKAQINDDPSSQDYLTQILNNVYTDPDPRAYPLSSYSYMIIPTGANDQRMTTAKRQTLADFMFYGLCQGQAKAGPYGYSPLPLNLVQAGFSQLAKLKTADPAVDLTSRDVTKCNNPTFVPGNLSKNHLAEIAPQPAACDKQGAGPCGSATGTGKPSTDANQPTTTTAGTTAGTTTTAAPGTTSAAVDPTTGQAVAAAAVPSSDATNAAATGQVYANPTTLGSSDAGDKKLFGWVSALELLALILLPGLYVAGMRRRAAVKAGSR